VAIFGWNSLDFSGGETNVVAGIFGKILIEDL
jgi:hypothetical protein